MGHPGRVDYHVHYYLDSCASKDMILPVIEREAEKMGLEEIAVLKHYSKAFPNGKADWVAWHSIKQDDFDRYLREVHTYKPKTDLKIFTGVETELVNEYGDINIDEEAIKKIDVIALSIHYMPAMSRINPPYLYQPHMQKSLLEKDTEAKREFTRWQETVREIGARYFVERIAEGYTKAIRKYPKIRQLSHMYDGLLPLRHYKIDYEKELTNNEIIEIFEPMMQAMVDCDVLWELNNDPAGYEDILLRANKMGVRFVATADAHMLEGTWGKFKDHVEAEAYIDSLGLNKGVIDWNK